MRLSQLNIVLAKTPYHVLLAHAALKANDTLPGESVLIYYGVEDADIESLIDRSVWRSVYFFSFPSKIISRKSVRAVRRFLIKENLGAAEVLFTCNDVNWRSQIFITQLSHSKYYIAEDGLGGYVDYRRTFVGWCYAEIYLRVLYPDVTFHYGKMNQSRADLYLSLSGTAFPWRPNSRKKLIPYEFSQYCHEVSARQPINWDWLSTTSALLVTQPLSDQGHWTLSQELAVYTRMLSTLHQDAQVVVKKHPAESSGSFLDKVEFLNRKFEGLDFQPVESQIPVEIICQSLPLGSNVFSIMSTGALNVSLLRPDLNVFCDSSWEDRLDGRWQVGFL